MPATFQFIGYRNTPRRGDRPFDYLKRLASPCVMPQVETKNFAS